jgi:hypothetical protein
MSTPLIGSPSSNTEALHTQQERDRDFIVD